MMEYPDDIEGVMVTHGANMKNAGNCSARQAALVTIINANERKYGNE